MKTKELIYMVLDLAKNASDDAYFTEEHVQWLLNKTRSFLLKREYDQIKRQPSEANKQSICLDLEQVKGIEGDDCANIYLRSTNEIPDTVSTSQPQITTMDYFVSNIVYVTPEKMRYTGFNKYLKNIIFCALGHDKHLYMKASNTQFKYLEKIMLTAVFDDFEKAAEMSCDSSGESECGKNIGESEFPIDSYLVPELIDRVLRELLGASYRPKDDANNAKDDLSDIASFIRHYVKQPLQRQLDGQEGQN